MNTKTKNNQIHIRINAVKDESLIEIEEALNRALVASFQLPVDFVDLFRKRLTGIIDLFRDGIHNSNFIIAAGTNNYEVRSVLSLLVETGNFLEQLGHWKSTTSSGILVPLGEKKKRNVNFLGGRLDKRILICIDPIEC